MTLSSLSTAPTRLPPPPLLLDRRIRVACSASLSDSPIRGSTRTKCPAGKAPVIDCVRNGIFKVLGKGELPKQPLVVKAKEFSKDAEKKIKAVGGACVLVA